MKSHPFLFAFLGAVLLISAAHNPVLAQRMATRTPEVLDADGLSTALGGPTLLTLHLRDAEPAVVFAEIAKQIGQPIRIGTTNLEVWNGKRITIDAERQPFWDVMQQLSRSIGFSWLHRTSQDGYIVAPSATVPRELRSPSAEVGMVRIVAIEAKREQWILGGFANPEEQGRENGDTLRLKFAVLPDPKLSIVNDTARFETVGASTEGGIPPHPVEMEGLKGSTGNFAPAVWQLQSDLRLYPSQTHKQLDFEGRLRFTAITRSEQWRIENVLQAQETSRDFLTENGTVRVTFHGLHLDDGNPDLPKGRYTMALSAKLLGGTNPRSDGQFLKALNSYLVQASRVTDERGVSLAFNSAAIANAEEKSPITYGRKRSTDSRDDAGEPTTYSVMVPLETREVTLPFELPHLSIPQFPDEGHPLP